LVFSAHLRRGKKCIFLLGFLYLLQLTLHSSRNQFNCPMTCILILLSYHNNLGAKLKRKVRKLDTTEQTLDPESQALNTELQLTFKIIFVPN
jgi:hypothetical protein